MRGYAVALITIDDTEGYRANVQAARDAMERAGFKFVVTAGGPGGKGQLVAVGEDEETPDRIVIAEHDNMEDANQWIHSEEAEPVNKLKEFAGITMLLVEAL